MNDIHPGRTRELVIAPRSFSHQDVLDYAAVTEDFNPIHVDPEFSAASRFGRAIVHGTLVLAPVWEAIAARFGQQALAMARVEIRFKAPVPVGDPVVYSCRRSADTGENTYDLSVQLNDGTRAVDGQIRLGLDT